MSSQSSRHPANAYAWYDNENGLGLDFISQPSRPFPTTVNERGVLDPAWLQSSGILTLPNSPMLRFPQPDMRLIVFHNNIANGTSLRSRPTTRRDLELNPNEQKKAIMKLKKEIYNPIPKKIIQRIGSFYSTQNATARKAAGGSQKTNKQVDDDYATSSCVICLEEFQPKQVVMVTPCNHMFHEDCILPWVKSHGKCPVCRLSFAQSNGASEGSTSANTDNLLNDRFPDDLLSLVRSMASTGIEPFRF